MSRGGRVARSSRRTYSPGVAASSFENECPRCGLDITSKNDMTRTSRGAWIHKGCASGADDE